MILNESALRKINTLIEEVFYKGNLAKTPGQPNNVKRLAAAQYLKNLRQNSKEGFPEGKRPMETKKIVNKIGQEKLNNFDKV